MAYYGTVTTTMDKDKELIVFPHYTDQRFREEQTVFGKPADTRFGHPDLSYDYSDRLWQWDYDKANESADVANISGAKPKTCRWYEEYLSHYFGKRIEIEHIISGVNRGNGYPYNVFGYRDATS